MLVPASLPASPKFMSTQVFHDHASYPSIAESLRIMINLASAVE